MPENHPLRTNLKLPANFPAFQFLFSDDEGRLYVATCEKDAATGQNMCDVFSPDGTYIQRAPLGYFDFLKWMFEGQPGESSSGTAASSASGTRTAAIGRSIVSSMLWH